jgi:hypothetical protein
MHFKFYFLAHGRIENDGENVFGRCKSNDH